MLYSDYLVRLPFLIGLVIITMQEHECSKNPLDFLMSPGAVCIPSLAKELKNIISVWSQKCLHSGILKHIFFGVGNLFMK